MTVEEFDRAAILATEKRRYADHLCLVADEMERQAYRRAGVYHTDRDPGFPCWKVKGVDMPYCSSPREALVKANELKEQHETRQRERGDLATEPPSAGAAAG